METEYEKPLVLVVDDDPTNLRILVSKLNREYRLGVAKSGTKALEYMGKQIPELVLLDVMMPDMDGFQVLQKIRERNNVPVLMLTAKSDEEDKVRYLISPWLAPDCQPENQISAAEDSLRIRGRF